jgi:hypothetical protein
MPTSVNISTIDLTSKHTFLLLRLFRYLVAIPYTSHMALMNVLVILISLSQPEAASGSMRSSAKEFSIICKKRERNTYYNLYYKQ